MQEKDEKTPRVRIKPTIALNVQGLNKPWILLAAPLIGGCVWLGDNTWIITNNLDKPYLLLAGPATIASIVLVWLSVVFCKAIIAGIKKSTTYVLEYLKKPAHRFWLGTTIFLIASILLGGQTFNEIAKENNIYGILGYAIEVAVDTASVFSILARQGAARLGDDFGRRLYTFALFLCATFSTLANAYNIQVHYVAPSSVSNPFWIAVAFALGAAPPLFIIVLSLTSDYVTDQEGTKLNPDQYEQSEKDRVRFDEIRLESLKKRKQIQDQINALNGKFKKEKPQHVFKFEFGTKSIKSSISDVQKAVSELSSLSDSISELSSIKSSLSDVQKAISELSSLKTSVESVQNATPEIASLKDSLSDVQKAISEILASKSSIQEDQTEHTTERTTGPLQKPDEGQRNTDSIRVVKSLKPQGRNKTARAIEWVRTEIAAGRNPQIKDIKAEFSCGDGTASTAYNEGRKKITRKLNAEIEMQTA
jgi:hypothetical protein